MTEADKKRDEIEKGHRKAGVHILPPVIKPAPVILLHPPKSGNGKPKKEDK